ncbi:MAG: NADPH-dependent F420 reductase, partial [Halobacteria archaeon]|nr:NADPH-dependent F420 reductase [Halobacteria archaeon]
YGYAVETVEKLDLREKTVVSPVVSMSREESFVYDEPGSGSAAEEIKEVLPETASLAGAFHNVAAGRLADPDAELGVDIAVFGDEDAKDETLELIETVEGMRGLDVGGFEVAPQVEAITPLLINVGMKNGMKDLGIRFV